MVEIGYALSSEEHSPNDLVRYARRAEEAGFTFALISDHYHPWIDRQGHSSFVWNVIGAIAQATERLRLGTGVTCPTIRIHPAIVAQAAATSAVMMPGRFFLGVGSGENLNEHILGGYWPSAEVRLEMLEEAVEVIRLLWQGGSQSHRGRYFTVENARVYTLPDELPPLVVAASGQRAAELTGRIGDGLISTSPDSELPSSFRQAGGAGKPPLRAAPRLLVRGRRGSAPNGPGVVAEYGYQGRAGPGAAAAAPLRAGSGHAHRRRCRTTCGLRP
jgi:coenzyme F420-dependent glucose-6-phosphate dehydrogenase